MKNKPKKYETIEGLSPEMAKKYIEFRTRMDTELLLIGSIGKGISYSIDAEDVAPLDLCHLQSMADHIHKLAEDLYGYLDDFIPSVCVELSLRKMFPDEKDWKRPIYNG